MNKKLTRLAERRNHLVAQAAAQRTALAHDLEPWRGRLALADQGIAVISYVKRHPALLAGVTLLFAALSPRRVGTWLQRGWVVWQIGRRLRGR
ncbi:MAG: YqjK-like family protein [Thiobacillus sp.]